MTCVLTPDDDTDDDGSLSLERNRRVTERGRDLHVARSRAAVAARSYVVGATPPAPATQEGER